jgi:UDP-glucose 4-epimerase
VRVALVGGAGFIGCAVAEALARRGDAPVLLDLPRRLEATADLAPGAPRVAFDFATAVDPTPAVAGFDALVHLGSTTHPARSMASMHYDAASNIAPSLALFEAAARRGIPRVVFASSGGTVYGAPSSLPVDEEAATRPLSAYGVSKLAVERYLALVPGVAGVSLRIANPYGIFQLRGAPVGVIANYARRLAHGEPLEIWGDGSSVRDYIAIEDVATAFLAALGDVLPAGVYNVGSGQGVRLDEVIRLLFEVAGRHAPVHRLPARGFDVPAIVLDCSRLRSACGWAPRTDLPTGIAALWEAASRG